MKTMSQEIRSRSDGASTPQVQKVAFHTALRREREASRLSRKELDDFGRGAKAAGVGLMRGDL